MSTREHVIELIHRIPDADLEAFVPLLERIAPKAPTMDEMQARWDAEPADEDVDDETLTQIRVAQARAAEGGGTTPFEAVRRRRARPALKSAA